MEQLTGRASGVMLLLAAGLLVSGPRVQAQTVAPSLHAAPAETARVSATEDLRASIARAIDLAGAQDQPVVPARRDPLWNGLLIGAAIGGALGLIPDYYDDCEECHDSLYASIAVGAGVGLLVDALRGQRRNGSSPSADDRVQIAAVSSRRGVGVRATVRWK